MHDINLTGDEAPSRGFSMSAETAELRGCWRIFFIALAVIGILVVALIIWQVVFVIQPWKTTAERQAEELQERLAELPPIPDVIGLSIVEVMFQLQEDYPEVLLFDQSHHAVEASTDIAQKSDINVGQAITLTDPAPGEPASLTLNVWLGPRPELPEDVPLDSFWFDHAADVNDRGSYLCLVQCHTTLQCERCHELRLRDAGSRFLADPEGAPELASAFADATGIPLDDLSAVYQGVGWYRVDVLLEDPGESSEVGETAKSAAVQAFPAAFDAEPDAEVILLRWVYAGSLDPIVEIGLERKTYDRTQWMTVFPDDIPWVVDRFAIVGGSSEE